MTTKTKKLKCAARWIMEPGINNRGRCLYYTSGACTLYEIQCPYDGRHENKYQRRPYDDMVMEKSRRGGKALAEMRALMDE